MRFSTHPLAAAKVNAAFPAAARDVPVARKLEASLAMMISAGDELAQRFYVRLFATHPELRGMFPTDMANQRGKLLQTLEWVVKHLEHPDQVLPALAALGRKHADFGTQPAHYPIVTEALLRAMADTAGMSWDQTLEADWRTAIQLLSARVLDGTKESK